jgi:hypothetical protein
MSRSSVLAMGRAAALAGMTDTCTISRVTGTTTNPTTGQVTQTTTSVYSGPCRFQELLAFSRDATPTADDPQVMRSRVLQLPVATSTGVRQGDRVVCNTCVNDPDLVNTVMVVRDESAKSESTVRRLGVEEAT